MEQKKNLGLATVVGSYVLWGLLPAFWALLAQVNSVFILAQRIVWSMVFMGLYMLVTRRWGEITAAFRSGPVLRKSLVCGVLITLNWGIYIYSVNSGHVLEASMGYFIEPVLVALMGVIAFREKPTLAEKLTFVFATAGILYLVVRTGTVPVLALLIGLPFSVYGAVKKNLALTPQASLFMETVLMLPLALLFSWWWSARVGGMETVLQGAAFWLLPACGVVTSIPLLLFNMGVKEIPYYFSGILMYINPTLQFLMGLLYFQEALDVNQLVAFVIIWVGIVITMVEKVQIIRRERKGMTKLTLETEQNP